jgi:hypothetical protein
MQAKAAPQAAIRQVGWRQSATITGASRAEVRGGSSTRPESSAHATVQPTASPGTSVDASSVFDRAIRWRQTARWRGFDVERNGTGGSQPRQGRRHLQTRSRPLKHRGRRRTELQGRVLNKTSLKARGGAAEDRVISAITSREAVMAEWSAQSPPIASAKPRRHLDPNSAKPIHNGIASLAYRKKDLVCARVHVLKN